MKAYCLKLKAYAYAGTGALARPRRAQPGS